MLFLSLKKQCQSTEGYEKCNLQKRLFSWKRLNMKYSTVSDYVFLITSTSGYATTVHGRGCNQHRCMKTFANVEITSLWRHWWRHKSETIRDRQKRRPHRPMKSSELSNGENHIALRQLLQNRKLRHFDDVIIWVQDGNCKKWLERILVFVRCTI